MDNLLNVLSVLILLSSLVLITNKRITAYIKTFRIQSLLIAISAGVIGAKGLYYEGKFDILIVCAIIFALKVVYIPNLLNKSYAKSKYMVEKDFFLNIPTLVIICCGIVVFTYFSISSIDGINTGSMNMQMVNAISVVLIGLFFMISRKKAIGQMVGFLVIENGLFITAMFSTHGMPFVVDMGIFIDLITAVMVMGIMVLNINEKFDSIDINKLKNLRG